MGIIRGLGDKNISMGAFDKVVASYIGHNLGTGEDFDIELLLQLTTFLVCVSLWVASVDEERCTSSVYSLDAIVTAQQARCKTISDNALESLGTARV